MKRSIALALGTLLTGIAIVLLIGATGAPPIACTATPCSVTTNVAWNTAGMPDTRSGTWGNTDVVSTQIPFVNVPKGYAVQLLHVSGDEIAAPHGTMVPNSMAYILVGLTNTTPFQSPYVGTGLGSSGTFLYHQVAVSQSGARIPINENVSGTLNADNILVLKQALFLSTSGVEEHLEASLVLTFCYTPIATVSPRK